MGKKGLFKHCKDIQFKITCQALYPVANVKSHYSILKFQKYICLEVLEVVNDILC